MTFKETVGTVVANVIFWGTIASGVYMCNKEEIPPTQKVISGIPLSVFADSYRHGGSISAIVSVDRKPVIVHTGKYPVEGYNSDVVALIQSEISDGDQEEIKLTGHFEQDRFQFQSIQANGYTIHFRE